jgi:HEAT repeat protein
MNRKTVFSWAVRCLTLLTIGSLYPTPPARAGSSDLADEQTLHAAGLGGDGASLVAFFQARARTTVDAGHLDGLLKQFAAAREGQEQAVAGLLGLGPLALPALRRAANDLDHPGLAARAARCLPWLDGPSSLRLLAAAARVLALRKADGAASALLDYLPFADNAEIIQEIQGALAAVGAPGGKADAALVRGLGDIAGLRRAAAGVALCRAAPGQEAPAVRNLLRDSAPAVRLRAALALAESGDSEAVPVLIDLLAELSAEQRRPVEELLTRLAGEWAPALEFSRDDEVSRGIRRDAWAGWWQRTDGALLLATLGKHTLTAEKREQVRRHIGRLGGEEFAGRENAAQELATIGRVALPQLREATKDRDPEVARRAASLIERIEREPARHLPVAVLRLLAVRKPAGAIEALLAYVPNAEEDGRTEEVQETLVRLALREGKPEPAFRQALADARPLVRATAARVLIECGGADGRDAARKLLADEASLVRLHVSLALARTGERQAVPVVIDLLATLPAEQGRQVEDVLYALSGDTAPGVSAGETPAERRKCRDAWAAWWKANADRADLARLNRSLALGYTLVCDDKENRVFEVDRHGRERWAIDNLGDPVDAVVLPGERVLIAEWNANRVTERDFRGNILWEKKVNGNPCNVQRLANGNTLIGVNAGPVLEVDPAGKEVFTVPEVPGKLLAARRSPRGDLYCMTWDGHVLCLDAAGKQVAKFAPGHDQGSVGAIDLLANGHVLVACHNAGKVLELDREGRIVLELATPGVQAATALPNGHILVASLGTQRVYEMDRAGKIAWEHKIAGNPFRARRR